MLLDKDRSMPLRPFASRMHYKALSLVTRLVALEAFGG
jgi:hypothetical protein